MTLLCNKVHTSWNILEKSLNFKKENPGPRHALEKSEFGEHPEKVLENKKHYRELKLCTVYYGFKTRYNFEVFGQSCSQK